MEARGDSDRYRVTKMRDSTIEGSARISAKSSGGRVLQAHFVNPREV
jgi:hypothetical protein